jgi:hypothetical protein
MTGIVQNILDTMIPQNNFLWKFNGIITPKNNKAPFLRH